MGVIVGGGNRSNTGMDATTLVFWHIIKRRCYTCTSPRTMGCIIQWELRGEDCGIAGVLAWILIPLYNRWHCVGIQVLGGRFIYMDII
jgi:hypothetical protein